MADSAKPEYERVLNDMRAIAALMAFYNAKVQAAALVMRYGYDRDFSRLTQAQTLLAQSVQHFSELTRLTESTYRDAAGLQTAQRQIPVRGGPNTDHWRDLLPVYQKELAIFDRRLKALTTGVASADSKPVGRLPQIGFKLEGGGGEEFTVSSGASLYADQTEPITMLSPELDGLKGIRVSSRQESPIRFTLDRPAQTLVGFFKSNSRKAMNVSPDTEQWNLFLPNAVSQQKGLPISVWAKPLPAGENDLDLGKGAYVVLGFVPEDTHVTPHIANTNGNGQPNLDWLFEN